MARLIFTADGAAAGGLLNAGIAGTVIPVEPRLIWGPLPSDAEFTATLEPRTRQKPGSHWLDYAAPQVIRKLGGHDLGLIELCQQYETVELWIDPGPNAQLILIYLLDHFRSHAKSASTLTLFQADVVIAAQLPETLSEWRPPPVAVTNDHLETASMAWQAYRQPTPRAWFDLLNKDSSLLPQLRTCVVELLEELPGRVTGLGATEMRILEIISEGGTHPFDVFPGHMKRNERRVFEYWEVGSLLDGLARGPAPAVAGLEVGPFTEELHRKRNRDQFKRYQRSVLSLTALGEAILARTEDLSRHNPIHRWWGGTQLVNERLWRWDSTNRALIAP
jgi:hypothetical protein